MKYTEKPAQVDAVQWTGEIASIEQIFAGAKASEDNPETCLVPTPMGSSILVPLNSWVTLNAFGHINVVPDEHFSTLYEPVA